MIVVPLKRRSDGSLKGHTPDCNENECYCLVTDDYPCPDPMCICGEAATFCKCDRTYCPYCGELLKDCNCETLEGITCQ